MDIEVNAGNILDQDLLRRLEALCIQEEPPACQAACPLHVDVRALCRAVAGGDLKAAFGLYQKAVPLARLVALTCDGPCKGPCLRAELGGAIEVPLLERAFATRGAVAKPPLLLPKRAERVAIVGGGLRGMAAANDLARKGYGVTIYEKSEAPGGWLRGLSEDVLPAAVLEEEVAGLRALGVAVECGREVPVATATEAAALLGEGFAAVFVACESPLDALADGATLLVSGTERVLAGRRAGRLTGGNSAIYDVFDGRSAATTIDRLMQGVSVGAGREKEGSGETALWVNLAGIEAAGAEVPGNTGGYTAEEAAREAARCIQCECMECVKRCGFLQHYGRYPRKYVREVYNNLSIAQGRHDANGMIDRCALCGQCGAVCPNGLDMGAVFLAARRRMTRTGKMPQSAFEFALLDMDYSLSDAFALARPVPGSALSDVVTAADAGQEGPEALLGHRRDADNDLQPSRAAVFFPGCQLAASEPELVEAVYADLRERLGAGLWLSCCGVMAHWAGDEPRFAAASRQLRADWEALGRPRVLAGCPSCAKTLTELHGIPAEYIAGLLAGADRRPGDGTQPVWAASSAESPAKTGTVFGQDRRPGDGPQPMRAASPAESPAKTETVFGQDSRFGNGTQPVRAVLHDACGARFDGGVQESVRRLAAQAGVAVADIETPAEESPCCGYGGLAPFVDSGVAGEITQVALTQLGTPILTYCVNCRDRFLAAGRESYHILELCYPDAPLRRAPPGWSTRQENRAALRRRMLENIWGEAQGEAEGVELFIDEALAEKLEADHILRSDLAAAIAAAEAGGGKLADPASGHLTACYRPANVTFWVEYGPEAAAEDGGGWRVYNAYSHRMRALVTGREGGGHG